MPDTAKQLLLEIATALAHNASLTGCKENGIPVGRIIMDYKGGALWSRAVKFDMNSSAEDQELLRIFNLFMYTLHASRKPGLLPIYEVGHLVLDPSPGKLWSSVLRVLELNLVTGKISEIKTAMCGMCGGFASCKDGSGRFRCHSCGRFQRAPR